MVLSCTVGDEGGFSTHLSYIEQILELLVDAIYLAGFDPEEYVCVSLDCAISQFYSDGYYKT
ncbi:MULTISPECIES: hypothetical protein [Candidatus Ichthyocystis]|uniref:hypothetical protein n=1 Tax=Candidatus Ichthyocystis TaxID=2929841 RepID=UPI000B80D418|nr:hypothetical protein [Candidatus Ichthyocystis sparus]